MSRIILNRDERQAMKQRRAALDQIGWTVRGLAARTGRSHTTVLRWVKGEAPVPPEVDDWLNRAAAWITANPPPSHSGPERGRQRKRPQPPHRQMETAA